jgi:hypothetical protein
MRMKETASRAFRTSNEKPTRSSIAILPPSATKMSVCEQTADQWGFREGSEPHDYADSLEEEATAAFRKAWDAATRPSEARDDLAGVADGIGPRPRVLLRCRPRVNPLLQRCSREWQGPDHP